MHITGAKISHYVSVTVTESYEYTLAKHYKCVMTEVTQSHSGWFYCREIFSQLHVMAAKVIETAIIILLNIFSCFKHALYVHAGIDNMV